MSGDGDEAAMQRAKVGPALQDSLQQNQQGFPFLWSAAIKPALIASVEPLHQGPALRVLHRFPVHGVG